MSRDSILSRIRANKPKAAVLPQIPEFPQNYTSKVDAYIQALQVNKGEAFIAKGTPKQAITDLLDTKYKQFTKIASGIDGFEGNISLNNIQESSDLKTVEVGVVRGECGVIENGAIWVNECVHRVFPFIVEHLVIMLKEEDIVPKMHQAYQKIRINESGFGVFIAGPSKTADIEQSLVIGAHGPRSLSVIII